MAETGKAPDQILADHWKKYGRHHFNRFDYEDLDKAAANQVIADFTALMASKVGEEMEGMKITYAGQFNYKDPTNGEESPNQGLQIQFGDKARIMCRLSGTGTRGATMRMYCEYWQEQNEAEPKITTKGLNALAQNLMGISEKLGKSQADNIA